MYSRLNVFPSNKRYSWRKKETENGKRGNGGKIPRYPRITEVMMQNDKSDGTREAFQTQNDQG